MNKTKAKQLRIDQSCLTGVNPKHTHGLGLWNSPREVVGIRCDKKLYLAFKEVAIAKFGSVCHPLEVCMATLLATWRTEQISGVNPSNTSIDIGSIVINRNMQERRKLTRTHTETDTVETETVVVCGYVNCGGVAVGKGVFQGNGKEFLLCADHLKEAEANRRKWTTLEVF